MAFAGFGHASGWKWCLLHPWIGCACVGAAVATQGLGRCPCFLVVAPPAVHRPLLAVALLEPSCLVPCSLASASTPTIVLFRTLSASLRSGQPSTELASSPGWRGDY
ncbi:hypothetical protein PF010_g27145 [Phytophthora fragariae]|uniref:Secreted protein n=1 Tax=Phytophthora fragariae TaxID=53985 RepID=A0A6G0JUV9_9STRA|nr:hypothetical protein PF010_g27145 [Phytophthora fragariae]KAE9285584.1 hypothetical protein PF008_g26879 [Phytophthora fragariae]